MTELIARFITEDLKARQETVREILERYGSALDEHSANPGDSEKYVNAVEEGLKNIGIPFRAGKVLTAITVLKTRWEAKDIAFFVE